MRYVLIFAAAAALSAGVLAQPGKDHAAHHPAGAASAAGPSSKAPTPTQMELQTKAMQDGMAMMGQMHGGGGARSGEGMGDGVSMSSRMMGKRMDMMEMMMQMMMDREGASRPLRPCPARWNGDGGCRSHA